MISHVVLFRPPLAPRHTLAGGRMIDVHRSFLKEDNGWRRMVQSIEIHELNCPAGDHDGFVLEPYVRDMGRRLADFLADARATSGPVHKVPEPITEARASA